MFFDFSSAFNTIQPRLLGDKLQLAGVDPSPHYMDSGLPHTQTTVYFLYNTPSCHLETFSDDSAVFGLITDGDDREYRWTYSGLCGLVQINAGKTKELVVDFRRRRHTPPAPVSIQGTDIDTVKSYKYLGVHLNDSLDWSDNTNALVKKGNSRLFLLRRLRSFGVQGPLLLRTFYDSVVASAIFYGIVCWASSITDREQEENGQTGEEGQLCPGMPLDSVEVVGNGRMMAKLSSLLNNTSHPLQDTLTALGSSFSERLLHPRCVKERSQELREEISWRVIILLLGLLSVFLLAGLIGLAVHYHYSVRGSAAELSTIRANLTERLQESNTKLVSSIEERDQLKANLTEMTEELKRLQSLSKQSETCPAGWRMLSCTCYFFSTTSASWEQSRRDCRDKGADLVVIESYEEQVVTERTGQIWTQLTQRNSKLASGEKEAELEDPGEATPIPMAEVVKKLLSGKAPDVDEICLEMLKVLDTVGLLWQTRFFRVI
ncbi:hypothetical protein L3Q82_004274 [Scortum barcoo]|uniref:Uncharacterized protein n=1 Tax=Scortum barcoo TaxID=214431 RepID=A0ACB8VJ88_9TELE|nr:hypothetical protein L3Q82_004274 [Scortum barcoo]